MAVTPEELARLRREHAASVAAFEAGAQAIAAEAWEVPLGPGQWTPAQVAEHLRLGYEVLARELAGGTGLRVRTSWWLRLLLRFKFLPGILDHGRIPGKAKAPSEVRPGPGPFPRQEILARLRAGATGVEESLAQAVTSGAPGLTHHVFGRLTPAEGFRFLTVHNAHHTRQIAPPAA